MINLFTDTFNVKLGGQRSPLAEGIERQFRYIQTVLQSYYARSSIRLPNDHILVQLLRSMSFPENATLEHVWATTYARAPYVAKHYGFTSPISFGRPLKGAFYAGEGSVDYIFESPMFEVDPWMDKELWRNLSPLKVLYHSVVDYHFLLPGVTPTYKNNFSVVHIDTALLVMQYHEYKLEQRMKYGAEAILNPSVFLVNEVLPKLYASHLDLVIINNMFQPDGVAPKELTNAVKWPPVSFPDISLRADKLTQDMHRKMKKSRLDYLAVMQNLPVPSAFTAHLALKLPKAPRTRQGWWLFWLARFRYMLELIRLQGLNGLHANRANIATLKRELGYFMTDKGYLLFQNKSLEEEFLYFAGYVKNI